MVDAKAARRAERQSQREKRKRMKEKHGADHGEHNKRVLDTGLWGVVRHPNYLGELGLRLFL